MSFLFYICVVLAFLIIVLWLLLDHLLPEPENQHGS